MRDILTVFRLLAPFAILAGMLMSLPMYASYVLTLDVAAKDIRLAQKSEEAEIAVEFVRAKGLLGRSVPVKMKKAKRSFKHG